LARCAREVAEWKTGDRGEFYGHVGEPDEVRKQMMRAADLVYHSLEECAAEVERDEVGSVEEMYLPKRDLHDAYSAFALEEDLPSIAYNQFCDRVKNGVGDYQVDDTRTTRLPGPGQESVWVGLTLTDRGRWLLDGD
ncbi:hypothetical protein, partial [Microbispora corallina]|uniref:hypothetical protein n=1 Tax=Microbispora corallina TaxID=83302 RepID=UPI0031E45D37